MDGLIAISDGMVSVEFKSHVRIENLFLISKLRTYSWFQNWELILDNWELILDNWELIIDFKIENLFLIIENLFLIIENLFLIIENLFLIIENLFLISKLRTYSWFQIFLISNFCAVFWMLYAFFWMIPRRLNFICRRFGTLCLFHLNRRIGVHLSAYEGGTECYETSGI